MALLLARLTLTEEQLEDIARVAAVAVWRHYEHAGKRPEPAMAGFLAKVILAGLRQEAGLPAAPEASKR